MWRVYQSDGAVGQEAQTTLPSPNPLRFSTALNSLTFTRVVEVYALLYAFLFASRPISDADFWFHLKTGQYVFQNGAVPHTELFSFTFKGTPWVAHGWLAGTFFYGIYSTLGPYALIFIFAVLASLAFWIVLKDSQTHIFIRAFAMLLGIWAVIPNIGVRPRVFTLLLSAIFLHMLRNYARHGAGRSIWLLVPLTVLWANLHGGYIIGWALIVLTMIGIFLDALAGGEKVRTVWPRVRTLGLVFVGTLFAAVVNPYGMRIYEPPVRALSSSIYARVVIDWMSPNFHQTELTPLLLLIMLSIAVFALSPKKVKPSELLLFIATLYATLKTQRNMLIFALIAAPLFARYFQHWLNSTSFSTLLVGPRISIQRPKVIILGLLMLLPLPVFAARLRATAYAPPQQQRMKVPIKAVEYIRQNQVTGNTFTLPSIWGGYVIWELPSNPVYIDGRDVYPEQFVDDYVEMVRGRIDWQGPFDSYGVNVVLIDPGSPFARQLEKSGNWERLYQDEMSAVFKRR
jgi:hypothetical protein